jgi:GMP synthase (glutamine-hydrolysing)
MSRQALIVVHQEHSSPGRVGEMLLARGCRLDRRCPTLGDPLPQDLSRYDAIVVFGGPQSAMDCHLPGIRAELDWLERHALPGTTPLLGICLGAQQMARVLGATVGPRHDGLVEIGYKPIRATPHAPDFVPDGARFYQWHAETFDIPPGALHLAENDEFAAQAFRWGEHAWGIEFHPEMTREMVERWCSSERGSPKLCLRGAQAHAEQLADFDRHAPHTDRWLAAFIDRHLLPAARAAHRQPLAVL